MKFRSVIVLLILVSFQIGFAQPVLTLSECYNLAEKNYPLVKQRELISSSTSYTLQNAMRGYWPQLSINGQATYQSDVTSVPVRIPGMEISPPPKDQYKLFAEVSQVVYDGGTIQHQKEFARENGLAEEKRLNVEMYKIREKINELYFGILLMDEQIVLDQILEKDIETGITKTKAGIEYGTVLKSQLDILLAERLRIQQHSIDITATREAYLQMLALFLNQALTSPVTLEKPAIVVSANEINRPELELYEAQHRIAAQQERLIGSRSKPKFSLFLQSGIGRPALNMLSNEAEGYYIGGIRMSIPVFSLYTSKNDRALILNQKKQIDVQKDVFLFNTKLSMSRQNGEISRLNQLLAKDDELIQLRSSIKASALSQMENGVITSSDYLREVNAENQARQSKSLHEVQLLLAQYTLSLTTGNQ